MMMKKYSRHFKNKDHSLSAQYEHTLLVTKTGVEILTARPEEDLSRFMK
jgi:methionyl aminopeptidase